MILDATWFGWNTFSTRIVRFASRLVNSAVEGRPGSHKYTEADSPFAPRYGLGSPHGRYEYEMEPA